jgi:flap endonuclease-1
MGVKLNSIISRRKLTFEELKGKIIAVDAPNIIMGLLNFSHKNPSFNSSTDLIMDRTQRAISHLYGILYRIKFYYSKEILPIFCFDGRVHPLKRKITKNQLNDFRFAQKRYRNAINSNNKELARQIALSKEYFWPNIMKESKDLLHALGVPVVESPASAESQCAHLVKKGIAQFSNSQDFDSLLFGCPYLIQNLSKSRRRKVHGRWTYNRIDPLLVDLQQTLVELQIDQFQLVELALMLETDYFEGIKGIGPKTALKLVRRYKRIENIISAQKYEYDFSGLDHKLISEFRKLFLLPEVVNSLDHLCWNPPNKSRILTLLCKDHHLNRERVEKHRNQLNDKFYECLQYFQYDLNRPKSVQKTLDMVL